MKTLNVALVQYNCTIPDKNINTDIGLRFVREAKSYGADIVLFPECWITAYQFPDIAETKLPKKEIENHPDFRNWYNQAIDEDCIELKQFQNLAKELSIGIVITSFTKGNRKPKNSAFVINKTGEIILKYDKVHTCDFSAEKMLESGEEFKICEFDGIKIGIMICYDREYPESARILMLKGAEIILVPNDCTNMKHRLQALSTRAYENMLGIAMANPPGKNAGNSCAFNPMIWDDKWEEFDNTIVIADENTEGIIMVKFNIDELRNYRRNEMMGNTFRKVIAYKELLNDKVEEPFIRIID
jgi:predicted amidohydrolase